jgi:hypothetical protein
MRTGLLFIQHVCYPEDTSSLLNFRGVEAEVGALLMEANTVSESHGSCNEEVGGLWVRCSQQKETLHGVSQIKARTLSTCLPLLIEPAH